LSNLITRSIAGLIFSIVVAGSALVGPLAFGMLFMVFALIGNYEVYELLKHKKDFHPRWFIGMTVAAIIYLLIFLVANDLLSATWMLSLVIIVPIMFCLELIGLDDYTLPNLAVTLFGWIYVILPFALLNFLPIVFGSFEYALPLGFFLILWANDTGAYFIGKFLGKHKLYERVSPNKTWEGLAGGIALAIVVSLILAHYFDLLDTVQWITMACIVAVFGNLGDLFESHLKRNFGVKDSGQLIPGHGGVLDRFDGLLLTLPVLIFYFKIIILS
jgi:phosphatidate cytidylyltransferase